MPRPEDLTHSQRWGIKTLCELFDERFTGDVHIRLQDGGVQFVKDNSERVRKPPPRAQSP